MIMSDEKPVNILIDETNAEIDERLRKLSCFCNVKCTDNKHFCDACKIKAMRYALRTFQMAFD